MNYKCIDCGTEINEGEYKTFGVCDNCWNKAHPQNLAKPDAYSLLAEVRAIIDSLYGKRADDMYSQALDDIKEKLSEHFS